MYSLKQIRLGLSNPNLILHELNRVYHRRLYLRNHNTKGVDIVEEDWDNLIILDGCRFDMFAEHSDLQGRLESRISKGSGTREFLNANFAGRNMMDTVYITANPQLYRFREEIDADFHAVINVWKEAGWNEEFGTVLPETQTGYAIKAEEDYPNKRLIIHYIQPHYPFIDADTEFDKGQLEDPNIPPSFWKRLKRGDLTVSEDTIWQAYIGNLNRALPHVKELLENLRGQSVVTADHGNMIGEPGFPVPVKVWGHPEGVYTEELVKVPWLVREGERKHIRADAPESEEPEVDRDGAEARLAQLGYKE